MKKIILSLALVFLAITMVTTVSSAPAPDYEYYFNPETGDCINHWRGDESGKISIPEGYYFSGDDDPECEQLIFNLESYQECTSEGGEYLMKSLSNYECSFDEEFNYINLLIIILIVFVIGIIIYLSVKKSKKNK